MEIAVASVLAIVTSPPTSVRLGNARESQSLRSSAIRSPEISVTVASSGSSQSVTTKSVGPVTMSRAPKSGSRGSRACSPCRSPARSGQRREGAGARCGGEKRKRVGEQRVEAGALDDGERAVQRGGAADREVVELGPLCGALSRPRSCRRHPGCSCRSRSGCRVRRRGDGPRGVGDVAGDGRSPRAPRRPAGRCHWGARTSGRRDRKGPAGDVDAACERRRAAHFVRCPSCLLTCTSFPRRRSGTHHSTFCRSRLPRSQKGMVRVRSNPARRQHIAPSARVASTFRTRSALTLAPVFLTKNVPALVLEKLPLLGTVTVPEPWMLPPVAVSLVMVVGRSTSKKPPVMTDLRQRERRCHPRSLRVGEGEVEYAGVERRSRRHHQWIWLSGPPCRRHRCAR